jgi:hypothetical protein
MTPARGRGPEIVNQEIGRSSSARRRRHPTVVASFARWPPGRRVRSAAEPRLPTSTRSPSRRGSQASRTTGGRRCCTSRPRGLRPSWSTRGRAVCSARRPLAELFALDPDAGRRRHTRPGKPPWNERPGRSAPALAAGPSQSTIVADRRRSPGVRSSWCGGHHQGDATVPRWPPLGGAGVSAARIPSGWKVDVAVHPLKDRPPPRRICITLPWCRCGRTARRARRPRRSHPRRAPAGASGPAPRDGSPSCTPSARLGSRGFGATGHPG